MKMPEVSKEINSKFSMNIKLMQMIHSDILITVIDKKKNDKHTICDYIWLQVPISQTKSDHKWLRVATSDHKLL